MGKILVLAEKPSVGRDLARVLKCSKNGSGFLEGDKYVVTWSLGHLVTLAEPEAYGEKYKSWRLEDLPMLPGKMQLVVIRETSKQFNIVKSLMKRQDINEMVIATDSGREGELVARWIMEKAGWQKPAKRLWISSQTDKAIKDGFEKLKQSREYDNLYLSAESRAEADWLVGLNITRALTCKYNAQLSAGRVQTPTLAIVVQREEEIRKFTPKDYWTVEAAVQGFTVRWQDSNNGQNRIYDKSRADEILSKIAGKPGKIINTISEAKKELPPLAYDLAELQRDANNKYGYSAKLTQTIMQKLYETHKLVTYPRTDSRYITEDMVSTIPERLKSIAVGPYAALTAVVLKNKPIITKRLVDNSKVTDHHAIIPTEEFVDLNSLDRDERNIYDLIVRRFIAVLSRPFEYEQTTVKVEVAGELFTARGKMVRSKGWKAVYEGQTQTDEVDEEGNTDQTLPDLNKGELLKFISVRTISGKTRPPSRYTEASLLSAMEHPGKFIDDRELKEVLESSTGLGTPATRADIIEKLFDSFYMERRGKDIIPTSKGIQLVDLVPGDLRSPELTAKWEQQLYDISKGKVNPGIFIKEMKLYASSLVSKVISANAIYRHDNMTREKCPECGKYLLEVNGKKGKMLICQDRECGYRKGISQISNARCPECHKKLEIKGEGEKKLMVCTCGYREKFSDFKKRKEGQVNKKEVSNYLHKQNDASSINSALADALSKWKND